MTLKQQIERELDRLAQAGDLSSAVGEFRVDVDVGRLEGGILAVDKLACAFDRLSLLTDRLANASIDELKQLSDRLAAKLNYLLEPISPVEIDADVCTVQMRSSPPQRDENGSTYYELLVRRGELRLCRYNKPQGQPRQAITAHVTREVFHRLAADFTTAVA
jgi:hypothetical protein